ncbi:MAG: sigma-54-dependent Fis family transcriptional regulator [Nitrospirae bacterium]|nr:sigma-54-dependent Fis family transcriptional regulator [Nitrospirota bacterium]
MPEVLVVDDDPGIKFFFGEFLKKEGYSFDIASNGQEALDKLSSDQYNVLLLDERMPGMSGLEVIAKVKKVQPNALIIMITAYGSRELAMKAIQLGAYDYFTKPVDIDVVRTVIRRAMERYKLQKEIENLRQALEEKVFIEKITAKSEGMKKAIELVKKVAATDVTVLVTGESGVGKELIARSIHELSHRREKPFISVNCAAIPEGLLESELFGHEKGAFTGAHQQRIGKFEQAGGGSLFLDEIGDLPLTLQSKLLRAIQGKEIERLGGKGIIKVDVRLIAATNKNLLSETAAGRFREDLLFRINVIEIKVPPLRERKEDIPPLIEIFFKKYSEDLERRIKGISPSAMKHLINFSWPGNVRELENIIQRALLLEENDLISEKTIYELLYPEPRETDLSVKGHVSSVVEEEEKKLIIEALAKTKWKKQKAAELLGISRKSLFNKMRRYGL